MAIRISSFLNSHFSFEFCIGFLISIQIDVFLTLAIVIKLMIQKSFISLISILFGVLFFAVYTGIFLTFSYITFKIIQNNKKIEENELTGMKAWLVSFTKFYDDLADSGRL